MPSDGPRARTASGADRNVVLLGPVDEVRDDQEVAGETHLHDDVHLALQAREVVFAGEPRGQRMDVQVPLQPGFGLAADEMLQRVAARHREGRQVIGAEAQFQIAAPGQFHAVFEQFRQIGEQRGHFRRRLQVLLGRVAARTLRVGQHASGMDADARLMRLEILACQEAHIVRRHHRQIQSRRQIECLGEEDFLLRPLGAHDLEIEAIREACTPPLGACLCGFVAPGQQQASDLAVLPGEGNESRA
mgnify:CR=1 FL=1